MQKSIWALDYGNEPSQRISNRKCVLCNFSNFSEGDLCFRCMNNYNETTGNRRTISNENLPHPHDGHETANSIRAPEYAVKQASRTASRSTISFTEALGSHHSGNPNQGLATSRWAPRNANGHIGPAEKRQIWTRTVSNPESIPYYPTPSSTPQAPDLGLPYQVQHYLLATIQRILEEACFEFASAWIPRTLHDNRWDCPEAVELSTWRSLLPGALPPGAIRPVSGYPFVAALADAVRIRNAATHRHLCDNIEMKRMALHAERMMSMFSDIPRRDKFHRLRVELDDWDVRSPADPRGARQKLEFAMREISEMAVDDMDWTPNAVSLQEILDGEPAQDADSDEMDLD